MTTLACGETFRELLDNEQFFVLAVVTLGCLTGVVGIVAGTIASVMRTRSREQTRRELAAYVAEGTLDPDKAVAMINAGLPRWERPRHGDDLGFKKT